VDKHLFFGQIGGMALKIVQESDIIPGFIWFFTQISLSLPKIIAEITENKIYEIGI
jgi:hypothetical protein